MAVTLLRKKKTEIDKRILLACSSCLAVPPPPPKTASSRLLGLLACVQLTYCNIYQYSLKPPWAVFTSPIDICQHLVTCTPCCGQSQSLKKTWPNHNAANTCLLPLLLESGPKTSSINRTDHLDADHLLIDLLQIDHVQIYHLQIDQLHPNLPLRYVVSGSVQYRSNSESTSYQ